MEYNVVRRKIPKDIGTLYKIGLNELEAIAKQYKKLKKEDGIEKIMTLIDVGKLDLELEDYDHIEEKVLPEIESLAKDEYPSLVRKIEEIEKLAKKFKA